MNDNNLNKHNTKEDMHNNDHNLDDIIYIDKEEIKSSKVNSLLTIIALVIVIFIIIIVSMSSVDEDENRELSALEKNNSEMVAPELVLQSKSVKEDEEEKQVEEDTKITDIIKNRLTQTEKREPEKDNIETNGVEVASEIKAEVSTEKNISETKKPTVKRAKSIEREVADQVANDMLEKIKADEEIEKIATATEKIEEELKASSIEAEVKPVPVAKEVVKEVVKEVPKQEVKTKTKPKTKQTTSKRKSTTSERYYIQVGAYRNTPSKRFISVIKNNGFKYKITTANGTKKLLIGPYPSRSSVDKALVKVRDRIAKSAFVVKK